MDLANYEFQSELAQRYIALGKERGRAEGKAEGRAEIVSRQLAARFGALTPEVAAHIANASAEELDAIGERLLTAPTLEEAVHEALILLFRNRPALAAEIVRDVLHVDLPRFKEARVGSADLTTTRPAEYRADLVIELLDGGPVGAIVLEAQQVEDENKRRWWPSHAMVLRYRIERNVCLLVVTQEESVARWASRPIDLGGGNRFTPLVVGPAAMPKITDSAAAKHNPGLAVLSAMVHGRDEDAVRAASIAAAALGASATLDPERARQYRDLVLASLGEAARRNVQLKAD